MQDPRHPRRRRTLRLAISSALLAPAALSTGCTDPEPVHANPGPVDQEEQPEEQPTSNPGPEDDPMLEEEPHVNTGPEDEPHVNPGPEDDPPPEPVGDEELRPIDRPPPTVNPVANPEGEDDDPDEADEDQ